MAGIGKLITSAASLHTEVQASLASFNFDFSLLKVEAPAEYASVGSSLTKLRRHDAEDGTSHITARRLAALFADKIPATALLFKTYGHRATEISNSPISNPKGTSKHGAFVDYVGADSTTIWAAATSGTEALAIHLLSCLLARIWAADEAVAVWTELVKGRKAQLRDQIDAGSSFHSSCLFASKVEISRPKLAAWDANTRAWLSSADRVKKKEQTQLRLVIDNVTLPVSPAKTLYESVMQTWTRSMTLMEDLLNGKALSIESGDLLLGLSSWHIYPDMSVIADRTTHIVQHDKLVPESALITIGLMKKDSDSGSGVHWSLPLAHLRHYGKPIVRTRHSGLGESHVPFHDLLFVALGSIFRTWQRSDADFGPSISLLRLVSDNLLHIHPPVAPWLHPLDEACRRFESLKDLDKTTAHQLMRLGYRYGGSFVATEKDQPPAVFGLTDLKILLRLCSTADSRVKLLRYWSRKHLKRTDGAIIRYFLPGSNIKRYTLVDSPKKKRKRDVQFDVPNDHPEHWVHKSVQMGRSIHPTVGLQTRLDDPQQWTAAKRQRTTSELHASQTDTSSVRLEDWLNQEFFRGVSPLDTGETVQKVQTPRASQDMQSEATNTRDFPVSPELKGSSRSLDQQEAEQSSGNGKPDLASPTVYTTATPQIRDEVGERDFRVHEDESHAFWFPFPAWTHSAGAEELKPYRFEAGVTDLAAVYVPYGRASSVHLQNSLTCGQVEQFLLHQVVEDRSAFLSGTLARHIWLSQLEKRYPRYLNSLKTLHTAYNIYKHLPNSYVDLRVRAKSLHEASFYRATTDEGPVTSNTEYDAKLRQTFSCIALFETGFVNIDPMDFGNAMAVCYQDSIYVAQRLLQDPSDDDPPCLVTRIVGNIGKPGVSILHPPVAPDVKSFDADTSWQLASYQSFDGKYEDNFSKTSLHLSFTGSSVAYGVVGTGDIHHDVYLVETLIQAYNKSEWIADLDVLAARHRIRHGWPDCIKQRDKLIRTNMCSIDTWDELFGPPPSHAVFRAHGNWMARLAAVTILAQQGRVFNVVSYHEEKPGYCPQPVDDRQTDVRRPRRGRDRDAEEVLEPWNESWFNSTQQDLGDENFASVLADELGDVIGATDCMDSDSSSALSSSSEIDDKQTPSDMQQDDMNDSNPKSTTPLPQLDDATSLDDVVAEEAVVLIC